MNNFGWIENQDETDKIVASLPFPTLMQSGADLSYNQTNTFLYEIVRKVKGMDLDPGPQGIGDCVSWGYAGGVDTVACVQIYQKLQDANLLAAPDPEDEASIIKRAEILEIFEEQATEAIYALSRCEVGKQWNSYSDGSVGSWAAKATTVFGNISRPALIRAGLPGKYDSKRAKLWGAKGLPDNLEPIAKENTVKSVTLVKSYDEAAAAIQNYKAPVIICSSRGFTMKRDSQGFCAPSGTWQHCMKLLATRWDRPGGCILQSWGPNSPSGPLMFNQPTNSFWADADVIDKMLRQGDSFILNGFKGYTKKVDFSWDH